MSINNDRLIAALRGADQAAADLQVMVDCIADELSDLGRGAFALRLRTIREVLEWAISDLSVPERETAAEKAA